MQITVNALFTLEYTLARPLLEKVTYPWEALGELEAFLRALGASLPPEAYDCVDEAVWIAKSASIASAAVILGPCVIGERTEVRPGAFIRGSVLVGNGCVVGNSTEIKNAILFDDVQVPHYNYVGDSVLGWRAHMGAGAVTSNVKGDKTLVVIKNGTERLQTGRKKVGAMLGDDAEIGCGAVLNPGTVIGRGARVYPLTSVRGTVPEKTICKQNGECVPIRRE